MLKWGESVHFTQRGYINGTEPTIQKYPESIPCVFHVESTAFLAKLMVEFPHSEYMVDNHLSESPCAVLVATAEQTKVIETMYVILIKVVMYVYLLKVDRQVVNSQNDKCQWVIDSSS